jgi:hypothetical protein
LVFALRLDAKDVACLYRIQPLIFAEKIEHIPPGSSAAAGANGAGVAPRGPEGEAVDTPTPGAVPVIFSLPGSPGVGRLACKGEVLFEKRANINHACIDHLDPSYVIQNVGIYYQAINQMGVGRSASDRLVYGKWSNKSRGGIGQHLALLPPPQEKLVPRWTAAMLFALRKCSKG